MRPPDNFPIRLTVCDTAAVAHQVVDDLQKAGFTNREISVVCSQESCEREFAPFVHEHPAGSQTNKALNYSGLGALGLGAAAVIATVLTAGSTAIIAVGALSGLAITGTLASFMVTRGAEKELADYYDQAVMHGKILVAVETDDPTRQAQADNILLESGKVPTSLPRESVSGD